MSEQLEQPRYVIGPEGEALTVATLPAPGLQRWVIRRKAQVVAAVTGGLLTMDEACQRYQLSLDEFMAWEGAVARFGLAGLRVTRIQAYRTRCERQRHLA